MNLSQNIVDSFSLHHSIHILKLLISCVFDA